MRAVHIVAWTLGVLALSAISSAEAECGTGTWRSRKAVALGRMCAKHSDETLSWTVCKRARRMRSREGHLVHSVPARSLPALLRSRAPREATIVLFYGHHCRFSAAFLPTFAKVGANLPMCALAVETVQLPVLGATFGVHGLPTVLRLQRGRPNARYSGNRSYTDLFRWAMRVSNAGREAHNARRIGGGHLPMLEGPVVGRPDWALWSSLIVCASALIAQAVDWGKRRQGRYRDAGDSGQHC